MDTRCVVCFGRCDVGLILLEPVLISQMPGLLFYCVLRRQLSGSSGRENSKLRQLCVHSAPRAAVELVLSGQPRVTRNCIASQPSHIHIRTYRDCALQVEVKCSDSDADVVGMSPVFSMAHDEQVYMRSAVHFE